MADIEINTNLDTETPFHYEFEPGTASYGKVYDGRNIIEIERKFSDPIPLEEGEAGERHYKVIETYKVRMLQRTNMNVNHNNYDYTIKQDSVKREIEFDLTTDIETPNKIPTGFKLYHNYPNPFNPTTTVRYEFNMSGDVHTKVYNSQCEEVYSSTQEGVHPGTHEFKIDLGDFASGIYFLKVQQEQITSIQKLVLLK